MKEKIMVVALFCTLLCSASAVFPEPVAGMKTLSVDMARPGCAISVVDYYGGHLESGMEKNATYWTNVSPVASTLDSFGINFECRINQQFDNAAQAYGAQWEPSKKAWALYYDDANDRKILPPVSQIYQLKSRNAAGFLRTTDQINGEDSLRVRFYYFCLFRERVAVCGDGQSMRLERPKEDYLPFILRILRGVKFIDDKNGEDNQ